MWYNKIMKLPITDQFLLDIYNATISAGGLLNSLYERSARNYFYGYDSSLFKKYKNQKGSAEFAKFIYYLKSKNYIKSANLKNKKAVVLTREGIDKALKASFTIEKMNKRKDGKWIMLIFDMPAKNRKKRDLMRSILFNLGYKLYQHSVLVTPYDVSEKTESLLQFYGLDKYVKIFLVEEI